jgi:hypothetical protein
MKEGEDNMKVEAKRKGLNCEDKGRTRFFSEFPRGRSYCGL